MSGLLSNVYERVASSYLAAALSNGASSIVSTVIDNVGTVFFLGTGIIGVLGAASAQVVSKFTSRCVQLNSFVPLSVRRVLRNRLGGRLVDVNEYGAKLVSRVLPIKKESIRLMIVAPIIEEVVFRLPLLMCSWTIDGLAPKFVFSVHALTPKFFHPILPESALAAEAAKLTLAVFSSIGFVYAHDDSPDSGSAGNLFAGGLALSHLVIRPEGGIGVAIIAHMFHNIRHVLVQGMFGQNQFHYAF